jgi:hypothetical protein
MPPRGKRKNDTTSTDSNANQNTASTSGTAGQVPPPPKRSVRNENKKAKADQNNDNPILALTTKLQAQGVKKNILGAIRGVQQLLFLSEKSKKRTLGYYSATQASITIQLDTLRPYDQVAMTHLSKLDKEGFSISSKTEFFNLMTSLENLVAITYDDLLEHWEDERKKIPKTWGIDFSPEEDNQDIVVVTTNSNGKKQTSETEEKKQISTDKNDDMFDREKELSFEVRTKILLAGTGGKMEIKKSFPAHLESNFNTKTTPKFSGNDPNVGISIIWRYLQEIHLANNVSYADKIEAVLFSLEGEAEDRTSGFKGKTRRIDYLNLWKRLFHIYGDLSAEIARQDSVIRTSAPKSMEVKDMASYVTKLQAALEKLETHGENTREKYLNAWEAIMIYAQTWFEKFVLSKDRRAYYDDHQQDARRYYSENPEGKFTKFCNFIYSSEKEVKKNQENTPIGIFNAKIVPSSNGNNYKRPREDDKGEGGPPQKKSNTNYQGPEKEECFICDGKHFWYRCDKSTAEKMALFKKKGLCGRCGRKGHDKTTCRSKGRCRNCADKDDPKAGDHHSSICFKKHGAPGKKKDDSRGREMERRVDSSPRPRHSSPERSQGGNRHRSRSPARNSNKDQDPEKEAMKKRIQELENQLKKSNEEEKKNI